MHIYTVKEEHALYVATVVDLLDRKEEGATLLGEAESSVKGLGDVTSNSTSRVEPGRAGGEDAADHLIGDLGRRDVEDAADQAALDQFLHRLPAGTGGVEGQDVVALGFERLADGGDARRGDAEHRQADGRRRRG